MERALLRLPCRSRTSVSCTTDVWTILGLLSQTDNDGILSLAHLTERVRGNGDGTASTVAASARRQTGEGTQSSLELATPAMLVTET
jgi:hypothetical protein